MKNLVLTIAIGDVYRKIADLTVPTMVAYAEKIGAEFKCVTEQKIAVSYPHWEKFIIGELLPLYGRILYFDIDVIVRKDCPNLFEFVPDDKIGLYNEGLLTTVDEKAEHLSVMRNVFREYGRLFSESWDGRFYNTGVMVVPQNMRWLFSKPEHEMFANFWDQAYLNMALLSGGAVSDVFDIGYKFNRMYYVDLKVKEHRLDSFIVHYAGIQDLLFGIKRDLVLWEKEYGNSGLHGHYR